MENKENLVEEADKEIVENSQPDVENQNDVSEKKLPMRWHFFMICIYLYISAFLNFASGMLLLKGATDTKNINPAYLDNPALKSLDMKIGIASIAIAVFAFLTRQCLAHMKKIGPVLVLVLFVAELTLTTVYAYYSAAFTSDTSKMSVLGLSLLVYAALITGNRIYYRKRMDLFH